MKKVNFELLVFMFFHSYGKKDKSFALLGFSYGRFEVSFGKGLLSF